MAKVPRLSGVVPQTPRSRWIAGTVLFVVVYAALMVAYGFGGASAVTEPDDIVPAGGIGVVVATRGFVAAGPALDVDVTVLLDPSLVDDTTGQPLKPITVTIDPTQTNEELIFTTDRRPNVRQVRILFDGDIQDWPFDNYTSAVFAQAWTGTGENLTDLPTTLTVDANLQGWHMKGGPDPAAPLLMNLDLHRTVGIIGFGLLLVGALIVLAVLGMFVMTNVYRGRRKMEPAFLSWIAAMLFATIPIRNFLPGNPPPGSWVDIAVVVWVIVALGGALAFGVGAWWRYTRTPDPADPGDAIGKRPAIPGHE